MAKNISYRSFYRLRKVTEINKEGKTLYYCPIIIDNDGAFLTLNTCDAECYMVDFYGIRRLRIFPLLTEDHETAEQHWSWLNGDHSKVNNEYRCMIPGERKQWRRCPTSRSCKDCKMRDKYFGRGAIEKFSGLQNDESADIQAAKAADRGRANIPTERKGDEELMKKELEATMAADDPNLYPMLNLTVFHDYSQRQAAEILGCSATWAGK